MPGCLAVVTRAPQSSNRDCGMIRGRVRVRCTMHIVFFKGDMGLLSLQPTGPFSLESTVHPPWIKDFLEWPG